MRIKRQESLLLVIDQQERLMPAIRDADRVIENSIRLIEGAVALNVPVMCSEQYPKGLGLTVPQIRDRLSQPQIYEKMTFSCSDDMDIRDSVCGTERPQLILCGVEAHVCLLQTALGFHALGHQIFVVADAISSRAKVSVDIALSRMQQAGVVPVTTEMVLFEWLGQAGTQEFKDLRPLII